MSLPNRYHLRRVAESSARACFVCYKPSPSVLITPDNRDFFYICPIHLKDQGFASPVVDANAEAAAAEKKRKEELEKEIEKVKKEYEEKMKKKKEKGKDKDKKDDQDEEKKKEVDKDKEAEKERDDKIKSLQADSGTAAGESTTKSEDDTPRVYTLHKTFYQMRVDRLRNMEMAKRNRERMKDASFFPSTPKSNP